MGYTNRAEPIGKYSHEQIARHRPAPTTQCIMFIVSRQRKLGGTSEGIE